MDIPHVVRKCIEAFERVIDASGVLIFGPDQRLLDNWTDELGRFRIWRSNIGAHRKGRRSLDFQVRDDAEIREQIIELLQSLESMLQDATESYEIQGLDGLELDDVDSEWHQLYLLVSKTIRQLFRMSMLIQTPPKSDFIRAQPLDEASAALPTEFSRLRVLFPHAEADLVQRLGKANIRRRYYFLYRSRRRAEMADEDNVDSANDEEGDTDVPTATMSGQDHTSSNLPSRIAFSETSFATSLLKGTHEGMPPRPNTSNRNAEFECPYCFCIITARSRRVWVKHIFTDLMPYMCPYRACKSADSLYDSRHHWFRHIEIRHGKELQREISVTGSVMCPLCLDFYTIESWPAHVGRHLQHVSLFAIPKVNHDPDAPWWPFKDESSSDSDDISDGDKQAYGLEKDNTRPIVSRDVDPANNRYLFVEQDELRLRIIQEGTDWDVLGLMVYRTRDFIRNWYQKEIRKWGYGYQLHLAAEQANTRFGRERERFREGRLAYPCIAPDCVSDYDTLWDLDNHMMRAHCKGDWKHWDLYSLDMEDGRAYQNLDYREVFKEDFFRRPLPPSYPPPPPPISLPPSSGPVLNEPVSAAASTSEIEKEFVPDSVPADELLHAEGTCRSDILPAMFFRFEHYYKVMANNYFIGLPEDPKVRYDNFRFLVDLTLPRLAKKSADIEQWDNTDFERFRLTLIEEIKKLRRKLNAFESESMDGTLKPIDISTMRNHPGSSATNIEGTENQDFETRPEEDAVLAIYISQGEDGRFDAHVTERVLRESPNCRFDKTLVSPTYLYKMQSRDDDLFVDLPRYLTWSELQVVFRETIERIELSERYWDQYLQERSCDRAAIEFLKNISIENPDISIAALYYNVKPPLAISTTNRDIE